MGQSFAAFLIETGIDAAADPIVIAGGDDLGLDFVELLAHGRHVVVILDQFGLFRVLDVVVEICDGSMQFQRFDVEVLVMGFNFADSAWADPVSGLMNQPDNWSSKVFATAKFPARASKEA